MLLVYRLPGSDDNASATFNAGHRMIKNAIKRSTEIEQVLTEPRLHDVEREECTKLLGERKKVVLS